MSKCESVGLLVVLYSNEMVATIATATQQRCLNENWDRKIDIAVVMPPFLMQYASVNTCTTQRTYLRRRQTMAYPSAIKSLQDSNNIIFICIQLVYVYMYVYLK